MGKQIRVEITDEAFDAMQKAQEERGVERWKLVTDAILYFLNTERRAQEDTDNKIDALLGQFQGLRADLAALLQEKQEPVVKIATDHEQWGVIDKQPERGEETAPPAFRQPERQSLFRRILYRK